MPVCAVAGMSDTDALAAARKQTFPTPPMCQEDTPILARSHYPLTTPLS